MITRRTLLLGCAGTVAAAAIARPSDKGGLYNAYFAGLNKTLRVNGINTPMVQPTAKR